MMAFLPDYFGPSGEDHSGRHIGWHGKPKMNRHPNLSH